MSNTNRLIHVLSNKRILIQQREELAKAIADAREWQEAQLEANPLLANPCTVRQVHRTVIMTINIDAG